MGSALAPTHAPLAHAGDALPGLQGVPAPAAVPMIEVVTYTRAIVSTSELGDWVAHGEADIAVWENQNHGSNHHFKLAIKATLPLALCFSVVNADDLTPLEHQGVLLLGWDSREHVEWRSVDESERRMWKPAVNVRVHTTPGTTLLGFRMSKISRWNRGRDFRICVEALDPSTQHKLGMGHRCVCACCMCVYVYGCMGVWVCGCVCTRAPRYCCSPLTRCLIRVQLNHQSHCKVQRVKEAEGRQCERIRRPGRAADHSTPALA